jgi:integrase
VEGNLTTPKYGKTRIVQMTPQLSSTLRKLKTQRKEHKLKYGWSNLPEWVFVNEVGEPLDPGNFRGRVHYKLCQKAELRRIRIHDLRHTYATIRISAGHNIADVSRQMGHASIKITIDTYYHWLPNQASSEVDELDQIGKDHNHPQPNEKRAYSNRCKPLILMVPRDRIELPTRGFSVQR